MQGDFFYSEPFAAKKTFAAGRPKGTTLAFSPRRWYVISPHGDNQSEFRSICG